RVLLVAHQRGGAVKSLPFRRPTAQRVAISDFGDGWRDIHGPAAGRQSTLLDRNRQRRAAHGSEVTKGRPMTRLALIPASILVLVVACSSSNDADGISSSSSSGGSTGACVPNNTDGASSCQGHQEPCPGGEYCSINICNSGCLSTANCPNGQFCDMA